MEMTLVHGIRKPVPMLCRRSIPNKTGMGGWEAPRELPEIFFKDLRVSILSARQDNYIHIKE